MPALVDLDATGFCSRGCVPVTSINHDDRIARTTELLRPKAFVMGDSAGGGLALSLLLKLRDDRIPLPFATVAMSPWTDLALTEESLKLNAKADPMLNARDIPEFVRCYIADGDPTDPSASPLYGTLSGLPPVLIQIGGDEILRDDGTRLAEKLHASNNHSRLEIWPRIPHVWQLFVPILPEAHSAIAHVGNFVADLENCA